MARRRRHSPVPPPAEVPPPEVRLGQLISGGLAPAIMAIVERGVRRRPALARTLDVEAELAVDNGFPPVRIVFSPDEVLVEDGPAQAPALRVRGELGDLIGLLMTPHLRGVPVPFGTHGRNALTLVASRRIRVQGRIALLRRMLGVIRI